MGEIDLFPSPNVIYLNNRALYHQLAKVPCGNDTIDGILQKIESFALFLSACKEPAEERTRSFLESSKADFLLMVHQTAKDEEQWSALTELCEKLRQKNKH